MRDSKSTGLNESLRLLLQLLRQQDRCPPASASAAINRATSQILILSAIYDLSVTEEDDGRVQLSRWCETFVRAVERGLGGTMDVEFSSGLEARIPAQVAQTLGLALGELLADAHDRMIKAGLQPKAQLALDRDCDGHLRAIVRDVLPPGDLPALAAELALAVGGKLSQLDTETYCERRLTFDLDARLSMDCL